jgi:hypothetical protein
MSTTQILTDSDNTEKQWNDKYWQTLTVENYYYHVQGFPYIHVYINKFEVNDSWAWEEYIEVNFIMHI